MKPRITLKSCIMISIALVLASAGLWFGHGRLQRASAQTVDGSVIFVSDSIVGLAFGESVRVCIGTTNPRGKALDWSVYVYDQQNVLLFELPEQRSPAGEWRCGDISRGSIPVAGDAGTGRAQVAMKILVRAPAGTDSGEIVGAADLLIGGHTSFYIQVQFKKVIVSGVTHGSEPK